ncbi:MAG: hypothetical protein U0796_22845 [Gemmatales bacterium]
MQEDQVIARSRPRFEEPGAKSLLVVCLGLVLLWHVGSNRYGLGHNGSDDQWQIPMAMHVAEPELLRDDPLITEVNQQYTSLMLNGVGWLARLTGMPAAYAVLYVATRLLLLVAVYHLAKTLTGSPAVGLVTVLLLSGSSLACGSAYFSAIPLIENKLVPRALALPLALLVLRAMIVRSSMGIVGFSVVTVLCHPPTGLCTLLLYTVWTACQRNRRDLLRWAVNSAIIVAISYLALGGTRPPTEGNWLIDGLWRETLSSLMAHVVYVVRLENLTQFYYVGWPAFFWQLAIIGLCLFILRDASLQQTTLRLFLAALAGVFIHAALVDGLGVPFFMHASLHRTNLFLTVLCIVLQAVVVVRGCQEGGMPCLVSVVLCGLIAFRTPPWLVLSALGLLALCKRWPLLLWITSRPALLAIILGFGVTILVLPGLQHRFSNRFSLPGLRDLAQLGMESDVDRIAMQLSIRNASQPSDTILAITLEGHEGATSYAGGWQIYSQRTVLFNPSLYPYICLSRGFNERYLQVKAEFDACRDTGTSIRYAEKRRATWLIVDNRLAPEKPEDPPAHFRSGPYRAWQVARVWSD